VPQPQLRSLPRRATGAAALVAGLALVAATPSVGVAQAEGTPTRDRDAELHAAPDLLDGPARGERAIRELGDRLSVAAARNDLRAHELRTLLRSDRTAQLDSTGRVRFVEPAAKVEERSGVLGATIAPLAQTFQLHSNPGADLTIFLDVDGADVSGTEWNYTDGVATGWHPAWDPSGNGDGFDDTELRTVQEVWAIVAEDYAPFDVDVTTEDPGDAALVRDSTDDPTYGTRVLVSPSEDAASRICDNACGGVAYLSVFDRVLSTTQPAWVFPQALGDSSKNVAEAAAHEAGHNLGLRHHGTATLGYYSGHGSWAPIMGVGYQRPLAQWSHGSYPGAANTSQDDVAVISSYLGRRSDEAPGPADAAVELPTGTAYVTDAADVDTYLLGTCTAGSAVTVSTAGLAPNLDVKATLRNGSGTVVATAAPVSGPGDGTTATGVGATVTVPTAGTGWTVSVDGVGEGTWSAGGYDDYGSLGAYTVSAPGCQGTPVDGVPSVPQALAAGAAALDALTLSWAAPADAGSSPVTGYVVSRSGTDQTWTLPATARSHVFNALAPGTSYALSVRAVNATGAGPVGTVSGTTLAPPPVVPSAPRNVTGAYDPATDEITVWWAEPASSGSQPISGYAVYFDGELLGEVHAGSREVSISDGSGFAEGTHTVGIAAVNPVGESARATVSVVVDRPASAPEPPTLTSVVPGDQTATVAWTAPADNGAAITGYTVIARSTWEVDRTFAVAASERGTVLTGLTANVTWTITMTATNAAGTSPESTALAVTPVSGAGTGDPTPPTPPTPAPTPVPPAPTPTTATPTATAPLRMAAPKVKVKGRKVTVRWAGATSPTSAVTTYLVDLSKGTDRSAKGSARKLVLKLKPGRYKIRVAALNATGWSPSSAWAKVRVR
jgi:hypothetical protein